MQKSASRDYLTRWSHQGYVLDGCHPGDVARGSIYYLCSRGIGLWLWEIQGADCLVMVLLGIKIEIQCKQITTCVMIPTCAAQARGIACFGQLR